MRDLLKKVKSYFLVSYNRNEVEEFVKQKALPEEYVIKRRRWRALVVIGLFIILLIKVFTKWLD